MAPIMATESSHLVDERVNDGYRTGNRHRGASSLRQKRSFGTCVSYGVYAKATGWDPAKDSIVIGKAIHAIGGVCVLVGIPVAPLHFVERGGRRMEKGV